MSVFEPARPPEIAGIAAHQLTSTGQRWVLIKGLRVIGAEDVWAQLSHRLSIDDLVVVGDFLVTGDQPYSGIPPSSTIDRMAAAVRRHGRRRGVRDLRCALERIRYGSMSPQETRLRLALIDAGLPEPKLNMRVVDPEGRLLALIDLAYPEHRVAIEYLGDHHRREKSTYRNDIARREMLSDLGWSVIFVTGGDHLTTAAHRVRRALLRSSPGEIAPNPV
ncbi:hypothetical protein [Leifsonia poae]|uniref:DUF559 domain-containing protein n=1 Tax=Leifsonia poae TaxID=110933 RepID=A0A9W6HAA7_9MICO|nr:hypothetical protein [Leifsonia poae]GLJ76344.1 hypothetical protein GCM10017584_19180 [Leifsonia poae]